RGGILGSLAVLATLVLGVIGTAVGWRQATRSAALAHREAAKASAISAFLQKTIGTASPFDEFAGASLGSQLVGSVAKDRRVVDVLNQAVKSFGDDGGEFKGDPLTEAALRYSIGRVYISVSQTAAAERHLRRAYELQCRYLGPEHRDTLATLVALIATARFAPATASSWRRAVAASRRLLDPKDRCT